MGRGPLVECTNCKEITSEEGLAIAYDENNKPYPICFNCETDEFLRDYERPKGPWVIGFYEIDRVYGGPEEGGWWYNTGRLVRLHGVCKRKETAIRKAARLNQLLTHFQRHKRSVGSVLYAGGRYEAAVYSGNAPDHYPEHRPHYE